MIFKEATGYFDTRENILALNDKFYGSLSVSRRQMTDETREMVVSTGELYRTLSDASETLFMQIWDERKKYDTKIQSSKTISTAGGAAVGGYAGATCLTAALGVAAGSFAGICLLAIGAIVGALVIKKMAKELYAPHAANQMEESTRKCIEQFKEEVNHTRAEMIEQVTGQITTIFEDELFAVDNCFTEFRMSVNIDGRKIPLLEQKMQEAEELMLRIENI